MFVGADQFRFRQNVFVHRIQQLLFRRPGFQLSHPIQSIQFEKVAMCQTTRRARADVPDFSKIIDALFRTVSERLLVWNRLGKRMAALGQIIEYPMHPYSVRRIRIIDDAKLFVSLGASLQLKGTETLAPSHVYFVGMDRFCWKAELLSSKDMTASPAERKYAWQTAMCPTPH